VTSAARNGGKEGDAEKGQSGRLAVLRHPLFITGVSALIASLLFPALTRQWQDRQNARELKDKLVTQLDEAATRTVIGTRVLVDRRSREAQSTDARAVELAQAPAGDSGAKSRLRRAVERERDARAAAYIRFVTDWLVARAVTRSRLAAYFPHSGLDEEWARYADEVFLYVRLASTNSASQRGKYIEALRSYLRPGSVGMDWSLLANDPRELNASTTARYGIADGRLTDLLLQRKNLITREILSAHVAGFSTNTNDFLHDLIPG
jgi:hypothetical protein